MADVSFVVQAYHYAQFSTDEGEDGSLEVDILDEFDWNLALVAVCDSEEDAVAAGEAWEERNEPDGDKSGLEHQPIAAINVYEVPRGRTPAEGRFVKSVAEYP